MPVSRKYVGRCMSVALICLFVSCGAKTGLEVPEPQSVRSPSTAICVDVPLVGGRIELPLETIAELDRADLVFLIDITASMQDEIDGIRDQLRDRIAPAVEEEIPDVNFGVATFADFPVDPFGDDDDVPFRLMLPMTAVLTDVQAAVNAIELGNGRDEPESQVEAVYQLATGEGFSDLVPASFGCPSGGFGYPCFRPDALPVVLLFTDAPMHNGPGNSNSYGGLIFPAPHTYDDAAAALQQLGARVIGFDSGAGEGASDLRSLASDTGTLSLSGDPIVFDIGRTGERLGTGVVDAIRTFVSSVTFDIDAFALDGDAEDGEDATQFIEAIVPLRADPMENIASIDLEANVFRSVLSGTKVVFQLHVRNDAVVPGPEPRTFRAEIVFRGDGRTRLGSVLVDLVIPGADGRGCDDV